MKKIREARIWDKLRKATKRGWKGQITSGIEYDAPGVHMFGEHVFVPGGNEDCVRYFYPPYDLPRYIKKLIKKLKVKSLK